MTLCDIVLPDDSHHAVEFGRIPVANERIIFGERFGEGEQTPLPWGELHDRQFHVGGVTWEIPAPGEDARPIVFLVGGARKPQPPSS